jgi:S1-C subfamily serine protease
VSALGAALAGVLAVSGAATAAGGTSADVASVAAKVDPGLVDINSTLSYQSARGAGTGIVLTANGEVLTNNHVVDGATRITATDIGNGRTYTATVVGYDPSRDISVLQLRGASGLKTATLGNSSKAAVGEAVVGIGNAGGAGGVPSTAGGSIIALNQSITASDDFESSSEHLSGLIETNAPIQPGDSGGSLVNSAGQVVGMDTAASAGFSFQSSATQAYAIPINQAVATAEEIEAGRASATLHVGATAFLGVAISALPSTDGLGSGLGFAGAGSTSGAAANVSGLTVSDVVNGDPAQRAGLAAGDVITSFDGKRVGSEKALTDLMLVEHPGDKITLGWTAPRGSSHTTTVDLASGPPA